MLNIKTFNRIAPAGLRLFDANHFQVGPDVQNPDAILLRSHPLAWKDLSPETLCVARAGIGVNNVPVQECTDAGVVVFNTPGANANSVKELTIAALLGASRGIVQGAAFVNALDRGLGAGELHALVEENKKRFMGREISMRTLGVVGLGSIGSQVAEAALALGMRVIGHDPWLSVESAWRLPSQVESISSLKQLLGKADYISLHVPLTDDTRAMLNTNTFKACRKGAVLLNYARQEIVDQAALALALDSGQLASYYSDFPDPRLLGREDCFLTPHLGASTLEAEEQCAIMAARQAISFLLTGAIRNSVNFPRAELEMNGPCHRIAIVNDNIPSMLGKMLKVLAEDGNNVVDMLNKSAGDTAYTLIDLSAAIPDSQLHKVATISGVRRVREVTGIGQPHGGL